MPEISRFTLRFAINLVRHHLRQNWLGDENLELIRQELGSGVVNGQGAPGWKG